MTDAYALDFQKIGDGNVINLVGYFEATNAAHTESHRAIVLLNNPALLDDFRHMFHATKLVKKYDDEADNFTEAYNIISKSIFPALLEVEFERLSSNAEKHNTSNRRCPYLRRLLKDLYGTKNANAFRTWLGADKEARTTSYERAKERGKTEPDETMIAQLIFDDLARQNISMDYRKLKNLTLASQPMYISLTRGASDSFEASDVEFFVAKRERLRQVNRSQLAA